MKVKHRYRVVIVLIALSLALNGAALSLMPDIVPVHYNFAGVVDRMGSKWEYLLFPVIAGVTGMIFALAARSCEKKGTRESLLTEKIMFWSAIFESLMFSALGLYFMWKAAHYAPGDVGPTVSPDFMRFIGMGVGVLLVLLGNIMPKARRNTVFGLRTKWSMSSGEVWRRSQRFGGFSAVALGFLLIVTGIFMDSVPHLILCMAVGPVWAGVSIWVSYRLYKKEQEKTA